MLEKKEKKIAYFGLFMILYLSCSFVVCNDIISSFMTIGLWIVTAAVLFNGFCSIRKKMFIFLLVIIICIFLTSLSFDENIKAVCSIIFSFVVTFLFVQRYSLEVFKKIYVDIMIAISVISLVGFALYRVFPIFYNINSVYTYEKYSNLFLYVDTQHYSRNMGLFWEPGAFQTFLNIALLIEILNDKINLKYVVILIAAIISTYSTTGYLSTLLIISILLFKKKKDSKTKWFLALIIIACCFIIYFNQDLLFGDALSNGQSTVFGKILNFNITQKSSSSASIRYYSIIKPIEAFLHSPVIGNGYENLKNILYEYTFGMNTCTFINWFAVYGAIFGSIMLFGIIKFSKKISTGIISVLVITVFFVVTMSENYVNNPCIFIFVLYGLKQEEIRLESNSNKQLQLWQHGKYNASNCC